MPERRWLWDTADELLDAWRPPGTDRTYITEYGRQVTEMGGAPDWPRFHKTYDQLLWEVVTTRADDLVPFVARFWHEPYDKLPVPLKVAAWRIVGLESSAGVEVLQAAASGIACYCDPHEEVCAVRGIVTRIQALGGEWRDASVS